ncbi:MAG TPA: hypothetical protein VGB07_08735 [Blastocatellia bacterium]|jgi:hypothetical protein
MSKPNSFSADEAKDKILVILNDGTVELRFIAAANPCRSVA